MPGRELFRRLCPHLDEAGATEDRQRQVGLPGRELFRRLCPHLDEADAAESYLDCKTSGKLQVNQYQL